jgi:hypothetical protein
MQNLFNKEDSNLKLGDQLSYSQIIGNIYYILQIHLIKNISLGNIFVDTILQFFILNLFIQTIINIGFIYNYIILLCSNFYELISKKISSKSIKIIITNKSPKLFKSLKKYLSDIYLTDNYNFNNNLHEYFYDENKKFIKKINLNDDSNIIINDRYYTLSFSYNDINNSNNSEIKLSFSNINDYHSINDFLNSVIKSYDDYLIRHSIKNVYNNVGDTWVCNEIHPNNNLDSIILDDKLKEEIIKDIQNFIKDNSKKKYNSFNIPFTKTYLFYGSTGTGKSEFIKVLANHFNYNLYYLNLENIILESDVILLLNNINDKKSILVIENICLNNNNLSYSCIQNKEDINYYNNLYDIEKINNILNIIYNHKNIILPELIILTSNQQNNQEDNYNNLSFIDVKYKFNNCSIEQFKSFYTKFYNNIIPLNILNKIDTSLFSPLQLIKIYLNNINSEKNFLLDVSKKNIINIDDDIHYDFNNIMLLLNNNKLILSAIVITHFTYLLKNYDNIIKSKYKLNYKNV